MNKWLKNTRLGVKLRYGFYALIILSVSLGVLSYSQLERMWENTEDLYQHPFAVSNASRDIRMGIIEIHRDMKDVVLSQSEFELTQIIAEIDRVEANVLNSYDLIFERFLGDKEEISASYQSFKEWRNIRSEVIELAFQKKTLEAAEITKGKGKIHIDKLLHQIEDFILFANNKAIEFHEEALNAKNLAIRWSLIISLLSVVIGVVVAFLVTNDLTRGLNIVLHRIRELATGVMGTEIREERKDEIGVLIDSFNLMLRDLNKKTAMAIQISEGDFSNRLDINDSRDQVGVAINQIASNFRQVVEQAKKVASGDYNLNVEVKSERDELGSSLSLMLNNLREIVAKAQKIADGDYEGQLEQRSEFDQLSVAINKMTSSIRTFVVSTENTNTIKTAQAEINELVIGAQEISEVAQNIVSYLVKFAGANMGTFFLADKNSNTYSLIASYAFKHRKGLKTTYRSGEGIVGQAILEQQIFLLENLPEDYTRIESSLGESLPKYLMLIPLVYEKKTIGVIELGSFSLFEDIFYQLMDQIKETLPVSLIALQNREQLQVLLDESQKLTEEMQVQQEELRQTNEELEAQTSALKKSEESLQAQQEELRVTNEELEEKTFDLEKQRDAIEEQNNALKKAREDLENQARELEQTSKYKSEFLANMSHELRTPLNSLLILSQNLLDNKKENLTEDQLESAQIIFKSGNDLLNLINEILDLSKIESGKMDLHFESVSLNDIQNNVRMYFSESIRQKGLQFISKIDESCPESIFTDGSRLEQVIRNLISNAIKFTEQGEISFLIKSDINVPIRDKDLKKEKKIFIQVKDTGIGIPKEKLTQIFEAFQQVDGSISRKYGGTGLGLSISREIMKLLHGEIHLASDERSGSVFTLILPLKEIENKPVEKKPVYIPTEKSAFEVVDTKRKFPQHNFTDDREQIEDENYILVIEDDENFAKILYDFLKEKQILCVATASAEEGLKLMEEHLPKAIILDLNLPGIQGMDFMDCVKRNVKMRHVPIHIMSAHDKNMQAMSKGAIGFISKPAKKDDLDNALNNIQAFVDKKMKELLILEDDQNLRLSIQKLLSSEDLNITELNEGLPALELIQHRNFDCIILDLGLPDITGFEFLEKAQTNGVILPPIIVYTGKELTREENDKLQFYTSSVIVKGVRSQERLLDETALFLHKVVDEMPQFQKKMLTNLYDKNEIFRDKTILIVDDDMRNVFALTQLFEESNLHVLKASNGQIALEKLEENTNIDLVFMDVMMPVMDGYEAIKRIRQNAKWKNLPVIALTAKAMKEDYEKCIQAGASDYLSKPVDVEKLFNLMRVWLY